MPAGNSLYQRTPGRNAKQKKHFRQLVEELKRFVIERDYTKKRIASELGVSLACIHQWWTGYTLTAKRESIERVRKLLSADRPG